ncbi:efflux RND transporter periplasmic adaptor subunit [Zeaxanthinibacter sp. PT1]|uniref:efflux RND transporter periplasmic adaptor subunit n=1 Tax=Zeaxanthinibacter TaxID=561554 RepID=UPI00234931E9|nr:efflux RND transporter periplasmic adaptor subunit [Zeaxanthinibacter sp. PT1]MDC6350173.1 efflux RND transporter periplasmic adaptor subunit [Zeaxanthinibacter sp. PT1]
MNKKVIVIILTLAAGLFLGYLIFGTAASTEKNGEAADTHEHDSTNEDGMWTCSMHPQIQSPEPGDCPICGMDLIPADSGDATAGALEFRMTDNAMALANIRTSQIGSGADTGENTVRLSGKIRKNEEANAIQASYFDGRIEKLNINYTGQEVRKGQLLATIYSPGLVAAQQELLTSKNLKGTQPGLYNAVRNKLKNWKLTEKQINEIENSGKIREEFPIYATVNGTVTEIMAAEGDFIKQGEPIVKVSNLDTVWASFDVYENQIGQFSKGQSIRITPRAYPEHELEGRISFIDPVMDNRSRTLSIRATLPNRDGLLKPGMFLTGRVETDPATGTTQQLQVPASAVMWTGERSVVYVQTEAGQPVFEMREVRLGSRIGDQYMVTEGLKPGEYVVTNGTFTVDAAAQLQSKSSMMNPPQLSEGHATMYDMDMEVSDSFAKFFTKALPQYLRLQEALVAGNTEAGSESARQTLKALNEGKSSLHGMARDHLQKSIRMLEAIAGNEILDNQREHFVILNENLIALAKNTNNLPEELYIVQCPMANNNQGALWLSKDKQVRNPYYGDAMLSCGSVIDSLGQE